MLFVEPRFFGFLLAVLAVHWALPAGARGARPRKLWLLASSYVFYGAWDARFLGLILVSTLVDFVVGRALEGEQREPRRRAWLALSLGVNLGLLGLFKYFDFFARSAAELLRGLGFAPSEVTLNLVLPVGISFYTFQTLSYSIDVYRRRLEPTHDLADFALFVAFFPQLVAGPIVRARSFLPQLATPRVFGRDVPVRLCLALFLLGFLKKSCLADTAAVVVDRVFEDPSAWSPRSLWLTLALYSVQVYGDFSGYSDMAIGIAGLLGYRIPKNFAFPFFARSVVQFWSRWHISLSSWIKDYLYDGLGGRRARGMRRVAILYVTMALMGLWHGADVRFLLFGLLHATYVLVNRLWGGFVRSRKPARIRAGLPAPLAVPLTYAAVLLSLPLFRGPTTKLEELFPPLLGLAPGGELELGARWHLAFLLVAVVHALFLRGGLTPRAERLPGWAFALAYGGAWALVLPWVATDHQPFVYFQF